MMRADGWGSNGIVGNTRLSNVDSAAGRPVGSGAEDTRTEVVRREDPPSKKVSMNIPIDSDLLHRVLAALPEFILIVDEDHVIRYINRVEPGYDPDDVIGMDSTAVLFPESRDVLINALDRVFAGAETVESEVEARHPDGSTAWYGAEVTPLFDGGLVVGAVIRADNVTELKAAREELAQVRKLLPMCAWCSRIRSEDGMWEGISSYLTRVGKTDISHGLCPACEQEQLGRAEGA